MGSLECCAGRGHERRATVPAVVCVHAAKMREAKMTGSGWASHSRVSTPQRRDRLLLIAALAIAMLTVLGAAGESLGYERHLKANTRKNRTYSQLRQ